VSQNIKSDIYLNLVNYKLCNIYITQCNKGLNLNMNSLKIIQLTKNEIRQYNIKWQKGKQGYIYNYSATSLVSNKSILNCDAFLRESIYRMELGIIEILWVKYLVKYYLVFSNHNLNTFIRGKMRPINWFKENTLIKSKIFYILCQKIVNFKPL